MIGIRRLTLLTIIAMFISCSKQSNNKKSIELILLNKEIVSFSKNKDKDSINIIEYCLINNSKRIYLINNLTEHSSLIEKGIYKNGLNLRVFDSNSKELKYIQKTHSSRIPSELSNPSECYEYMINKFLENEKFLKNNSSLKYFGLYERNNIFFLYPGETIYFQYCVCLNNFYKYDEVRSGFVSLDFKKKYYTKLSIASDSTNYKNVLPKDVLKTIDANNVKVYHGIIESNNRVPVKVIE